MSLRPLAYVAIAEAFSFLCLLVATAIKYGANQPIGVEILGPLHGMLFVGYGALAVIAKQQHGWSIKKLVVVLLGAVVPIAGFFAGRELLAEDAHTVPHNSGQSA